jgi:hypothetical protein
MRWKLERAWRRAGLFSLLQLATMRRNLCTPCALSRQTGDTLMPLLFYFPVIVMSGFYEAAADDMAQIYSFWLRPRE